jgi:hypothetical protein
MQQLSCICEPTLTGQLTQPAVVVELVQKPVGKPEQLLPEAPKQVFRTLETDCSTVSVATDCCSSPGSVSSAGPHATNDTIARKEKNPAFMKILVD